MAPTAAEKKKEKAVAAAKKKEMALTAAEKKKEKAVAAAKKKAAAAAAAAAAATTAAAKATATPDPQDPAPVKPKAKPALKPKRAAAEKATPEPAQPSKRSRDTVVRGSAAGGDGVAEVAEAMFGSAAAEAARSEVGAAVRAAAMEGGSAAAAAPETVQKSETREKKGATKEKAPSAAKKIKPAAAAKKDAATPKQPELGTVKPEANAAPEAKVLTAAAKKKPAVAAAAAATADNATATPKEPKPRAKPKTHPQPRPKSAVEKTTSEPVRVGKRSRDTTAPGATANEAAGSAVVVEAAATGGAVAEDSVGLKKKKLRGGGGGGSGGGGHDIRVLISSGFDKPQHDKLASQINRLKGTITTLASDFTHFLTAPPLGRSKHVLCALAAGRPVVGESWLTASSRAGSFVPADPHLCRHAEFEKLHGFDLQCTLDAARSKLLFAGVRAFVVPTVGSSRGAQPKDAAGEMLREVLPLAGAEMASAADVRGASAEELAGDGWLVIATGDSSEAAVRQLVTRGAAVQGHEAVLAGILRHRLVRQTHRP